MARAKPGRRVEAFGFNLGRPRGNAGTKGGAPGIGRPGSSNRGCTSGAPSTRARRAFSNKTNSDSAKYRSDAPDQVRKACSHLRRKTVSGTREGQLMETAQRMDQFTDTTHQNNRPAAELNDVGALFSTKSGAYRGITPSSGRGGSHEMRANAGPKVGQAEIA